MGCTSNYQQIWDCIDNVPLYVRGGHNLLNLRISRLPTILIVRISSQIMQIYSLKQQFTFVMFDISHNHVTDQRTPPFPYTPTPSKPLL
jgi:hypothetical protein